jgi:hypothetical protein
MPSRTQWLCKKEAGWACMRDFSFGHQQAQMESLQPPVPSASSALCMGMLHRVIGSRSSALAPSWAGYSGRYLFFEQPDRLSPEIWPKLELGGESAGFSSNQTNWNNTKGRWGRNFKTHEKCLCTFSPWSINSAVSTWTAWKSSGPSHYAEPWVQGFLNGMKNK